VKHHFGDFLDRSGGHWQMTPNAERHRYRLPETLAASQTIRIATISREDEHWRDVARLPRLEELTLHEPSQERLDALRCLPSLKRLRITHARPKDIKFLEPLRDLEELVFEYVSGFDDISPVGRLPNLRALHLENLRRVRDFSGLSAAENLKYLSIDGTFDWRQPIVSFEFLAGLTKLEFFRLGQIQSLAPTPALLPLARLTGLKKIVMFRNLFTLEDYALLSVGLEGVAGAEFSAYERWAARYIDLSHDDIRSRMPRDQIRANHPEVLIMPDGKRRLADPDFEYFEFLGKRAGRVKCKSSHAMKKCEDYEARFEAAKSAARSVLTA
jgi:hypothetical protein